MSDQRPSDVLGALPRRRPHRRSDKRASATPADGTAAAPPARRARSKSQPKPKQAPRATAAPPNASAASSTQTGVTRGRRSRPLRQPAQPPGTPPTPGGRRPAQSNRRHILGTAAQAAAELAEIGLSVGTRALRNAVGRLPRP